MACTEPFNIESQIKRVFNEKFKLIAGKEYFEGNETDMITNFFEIVTNYKPSEKPIIQDKPIQDKPIQDKPIQNNPIQDKPNIQPDSLICKACNKTFCKFSGFRKHIDLGRCKGKPSDMPSVSPVHAKPNRVTCPKCNKQFQCQYNLNRHSKSGCKANIVKDLLGEPEGQSMVTQLLEIILTNIPGKTINNNQYIINNNQ